MILDNKIESKWLTRILYVLIFLFALGFGNYERYILAVVLLIYSYVVFISGGRLSIFRRSPVVPLALWGIIYFAFYTLEGNDFVTGLFYYFIGPVLFWLVGRDIASEKDDNTNLYLVLAVCSGLLVHGILNISTSIAGGYFLYNAEYIHDYWSGRMVSRTIVGMYMTPFVCAAIPIIFLWDKGVKTIIKMLLVAGTIAALGLSIYVGNRAILAIAVLVLVFSVIYGMRVSKNKIRSLLAIIIGLFLMVIIMSGNVINVGGFIENSFLGRRNTNLLQDGRWTVYAYVFKHFFDYILGWISSNWGIQTAGLEWAHNIWLDIYIYSGLIPAVAFLTFSVKTFRNSISIVKCGRLSTSLRMISIIVLIGVFLNWAVEPILVANPYYFAICCFIFGSFEKWEQLSKAL
jgi:hypothetical protein